MKPQVSLIRDASDRALPPSIFLRERSSRGGQRARFRLVIRSRSDVQRARNANVPVSLLEPATVAALGYPLQFKPRLILAAAEAASLAESPFKLLVFQSAEGARNPTLEDTIVAMLSIDPLGARRIALANRERVDGVRLLKRIFQENLEGRAYRVRLGEFAPGLPVASGVQPLSRTALRVEDARQFAHGPSA